MVVKRSLSRNRIRNLSRISRKRLTLEDKNQKGGSPAYKLHGNLGLLSKSSLEYNPLGLTTMNTNFSDHIVATSGGGRSSRTKRKKRGSRSKRQKRGSRSKRKIIRLKGNRNCS